MMRPTDDDVRRQLFDAIAHRVSAQAPASASTADTVLLNSCVLRVVPRSGAGGVALITMTFYHPLDKDAPNRFTVSRADQHDTLVKLDDGDPETIDAVGCDLADLFVRQARRSTSP